MEVDTSPAYRTMVYHFGGGDAYFFGLALIILATALAGQKVARWRPSFSLCMGALGVVWVALSSVAMNEWVALAGGVFFIAWFAAEIWGSGFLRSASRFLITLVAVAAVLGELPYQRSPIPLEGPKPQTIYVIGDSVSSGLQENEAKTWPKVLGGKLEKGWKVVNLAQPGATAKSALAQASKLGDGMAIIEIGGNDVLGSTTPEVFELELDNLLKAVCTGRTVVMMELPLPPLRQNFSAIQRNLAAKYDVVLIPRRLLAGVFSTPGATLDGIHLSQVGHDLLANYFATWLKL